MYKNKGKDKKQNAVMKQSFVLCILINVKREGNDRKPHCKVIQIKIFAYPGSG